MKKTKSASLIQTHNTHTAPRYQYKKSIQLQSFKPTWPRLTITKSVSNLPNSNNIPQLSNIPNHPHQSLNNKILYNQQQTSDTATNYQPINNNIKQSLSNKPSIILKDKLFTLHTQIDRLQQQIAESRQYGKNKSKDYQQQLKKYDNITENIKQIQNIKLFQQQKVIQINNNINMLYQDFESKQMNLQHNLAEKQYCEQIIQQYQREYQTQAIHVLNMLQKQQQNIQLQSKIQQIQCELKTKQKQLSNWKQQINYDLQQKIIKNKITQLRIDLMKSQQQANKYADTHKIMKIRQLLCVFIKQYALQNNLILTSNQLNQNQQGIQIYICKNNICQQFQQFVIQYRNKDNKQKYNIQTIQKYFNILNKIQVCINNSKYKLDRKINKQYIQQITQLRKQVLKDQQKINNNIIQINKIKQQIQIVFANQSVAIIQHLRQNTGRYQLTEIKIKLKKIKQEQKIRINKIKQINKMYNYLKNKCYDFNHVDFMNQLAVLNQNKKKECNILKGLVNKINGLKQEKDKLQNDISMAVSKWSQASLKKQQLKKLYKDLNQLNKQIRQAQIATLNQKSMRTTIKQKQPMMISKKSQILANCMRETLKLRINGTYNKNKENQNKLINVNSNTKLSSKKSSIIIHEQFKTRKPSLSGIKSTKNKIQTYNRSARDSLTAVLISKFGG